MKCMQLFVSTTSDHLFLVVAPEWSVCLPFFQENRKQTVSVEAANAATAKQISLCTVSSDCVSVVDTHTQTCACTLCTLCAPMSAADSYLLCVFAGLCLSI